MIDAADGTASVISASNALAVAATVATLEHLRVDRERGGRVLVADLRLDIGRGCTGSEHQRDERATERVCSD
jgi:hypothetical protein